MSDELDKVCRVLDKLTLDSLMLMEEEIQMKLNAENAMCGGETHLAKSRYILGQNNVSALQLPTENSDEFSAMIKVIPEEDEKLFGEKAFALELTKEEASNVDNKEKMQNPIRWFGVLLPQNMHSAQNMYRQALQWIVKAANIQTQLFKTCEKIEQLKDYKAKLKCEASEGEKIEQEKEHKAKLKCETSEE